MGLRAWARNPDAIWRHPILGIRYVPWVLVGNVAGAVARFAERRSDRILARYRAKVSPREANSKPS